MPGLLDIVRTTLRDARPGEMFSEALDLVVEQAGASAGALFVLDLRRGHFEVACEPVGLDLSEYEPVWVGNQLEFAADSDVVVETNAPSSPLVATATRNTPTLRLEHPDLDWSSLTPSPLPNALMLPVLRADTCLAVLLLSRSRAFELREQRELQASAQALAAIYDLRTQYRLLGEMRTPLDLRQANQEFFDSVIDLLTQSSGMEFIAIRRLEPNGDLTTLTAQKIDVANANIPAGSALAFPFRLAIETRDPVSIASTRLEGVDEAISTFAPEVRAFVAVPIVLGRSREDADLVRSSTADDVAEADEGRVFGTLSVACRVEYEFSPIERLGLMSLAGNIGLAIENYTNISRMSVLREKQVEAGAALQAQEMAQGFRHEIRKKLDNINGIFATSAPSDVIERMVHRQTSAIADVLDEWRSYASGFEYRWDWVDIASLWEEALSHAEFQLSQANVEVRKSQLPRNIEIFCSPPHFVRFVLGGLILNSVDAFRDRSSRTQRQLGLSYAGEAGGIYTLRYFDTAGGLRSDRVRGLQRRRADWNELPPNQVIFEAGFSTKSTDTSGVGGGYGLYLARLTMSQHESAMELVEVGEPGAVFDLRLPQHHVRNRSGRR